MIHEISYLETDASLYKLESVARLNLSDVISHLECNWLFVASGLWSFNIFVINSPSLLNPSALYTIYFTSFFPNIKKSEFEYGKLVNDEKESKSKWLPKPHIFLEDIAVRVFLFVFSFSPAARISCLSIGCGNLFSRSYTGGPTFLSLSKRKNDDSGGEFPSLDASPTFFLVLIFTAVP